MAGKGHALQRNNPDDSIPGLSIGGPSSVWFIRGSWSSPPASFTLELSEQQTRSQIIFMDEVPGI